MTCVLALTLTTEVAEGHRLFSNDTRNYLFARASSRESRRLSMILSMSPRDCWTAEIPICLRLEAQVSEISQENESVALTRYGSSGP